MGKVVIRRISALPAQLEQVVGLPDFALVFGIGFITGSGRGG
jgi:hypothetical protein